MNKYDPFRVNIPALKQHLLKHKQNPVDALAEFSSLSGLSMIKCIEYAEEILGELPELEKRKQIIKEFYK